MQREMAAFSSAQSVGPSAFQYCLWLLVLAVVVKGSLISSSEVQLCQRNSDSFDPLYSTGEACSKKFIVALAIRNGQGDTNKIYADIKFVNNRTTSPVNKEQLKKPFRITVTKSDVHIHYPVRYISSVNNQPTERYFTVQNPVLGINACNDVHHCEGLEGFCCYSTHKEKLSQAWEYKRAVASQVGHYFSHLYSHAICMNYDDLYYNVFEIKKPYLTYKINVTVQQLDYKRKGVDGNVRDVWSTVGFAEIGPERIGQNTIDYQNGITSSPKIGATWLGDFAMNSHLAYFNSKYLLTPDWRASSFAATKRDQVTGGSTEWLIVDKHIVDDSGDTCNKIGSNFTAFSGQENRCFQKQFSCFQVTPQKIWNQAKALKEAGVNTHYFPPFYGDYVGPTYQRETGERGVPVDFQLVYRLNQMHKSLVTLIFTADSVAFVQHMGKGRIVEALIEDFKALSGSAILTVTIQNTGPVTADYSVSIGQCTEGIIRVAEQTKSIDPRVQKVYNYEISASLNIEMNHSCTILLTDNEGSMLDSKTVEFTTEEGCIYCPAGQCTCNCKPALELEGFDDPNCKLKKEEEYINPFWEPKLIIIEACNHCWFTNSFTNPYNFTFMAVVGLLALGMIKMLCGYICCKTKDGRPIDIAGVLLGTSSEKHTRKKQRSATFQFLLGACFFVYLPLLPLLIIFCGWRRRRIARKRLKKKADRKRQRLLKKKQECMAAMQGLMVTGLVGEENTICLDEALKAEAQKEKFKAALPKMLVVSSSSDTDEKEFAYKTDDETEAGDLLSEDEEFILERHPNYRNTNKKKTKKRKKRK